ncbi:methyltransferase domain-containing protein [Castellaniella caeni]|uniref:methyltransferase domain-containing protein n=1 Tax=Castellaniella caeni TaxID=266123 RepID=UPI000C9FD110|nr:methyltransferase domain-containing protein [Castellaniella caeni]
MSQLPRLPIDPAAVARQFARRAPLDAPQFLFGEIAQRMLRRLSYIRIDPRDILDAGCGAAHALDPLSARYPNLHYIGQDTCTALLDTARERHSGKPGFWHRLRNKPTPQPEFIQTDLAETGLPDQSLDLVWSNLALHWHPEPHLVLQEWRRILRIDALAMYSSLGPGSLRELREAVAEAGLQTQPMEFVDMHDFGDLMIQVGFADPVMDQEIITLTYRTAEKLLEDVYALGGNPHPQRRAGLAGRTWRARLIQALERRRHDDGTIHLSLEVAYGHAWRAKARQGVFGDLPVATFKRARPLEAGKPPPRVVPRKLDGEE